MDQREITRLRKRLSSRKPGPFHFPELYGPDWDRLAIGDKVRKGRDFLRAVQDEAFPGVRDTGKKKDGGRLYRWCGDPAA